MVSLSTHIDAVCTDPVDFFKKQLKYRACEDPANDSRDDPLLATAARAITFEGVGPIDAA